MKRLGYKMGEHLKYLTVSEVQKIMLAILADMIKYFNEHNYHYVLTGGSALGAVRHHGFIPWDDDADVALPRAEYERFIREYRPSNSQYELLTPYNTENWLYAYARVSDTQTQASGKWAMVNNGVYVDVFPIDAVPKSKAEQKMAYYRMKYLDVMRNSTRRIAISKQEPGWWLKPLLIKYAQRHTTGWWVQRMDKLAQKMNQQQVDRSNIYSLYIVQGLNKTRENFPLAIYQHRQQVPFENLTVYIPAASQIYLTQMYDNWQALPPKNKQKTHARFYYKGVEVHD